MCLPRYLCLSLSRTRCHIQRPRFIAATVLSLTLLSSTVEAQGVVPPSGKPLTAPEWVARLERRYDVLFSSAVSSDTMFRPRQDRFLARMTAIPAAAELRPLVEKLLQLTDWEGLVLTLPAFNRLWSDSTFDITRLVRLNSRAQFFPSARLPQWQVALASATNTDVGTPWAALLVLDTDPLFSSGAYSEDIEAMLQARLSHVPPAHVDTLSALLGIAPADAAMHVVTADFAFDGSTFRPSLFVAAVSTLRAPWRSASRRP